MSAGRSAADMGARTQAAAASIQISTLLVRGALSEIVDEAGVEDFRRLMPHAELVDVAEAGHMVAGDRNDIFNDAIPEASGKTDGRRAVTPVPVAAAPSLVFLSLADAAGT
jgi:pimeloyl-ACP methyl ester carboxylesterase